MQRRLFRVRSGAGAYGRRDQLSAPAGRVRLSAGDSGKGSAGFPEEPGKELLLQILEKKGLISLDYDKPLKDYHTPAYDASPVRGSMALTKRGQDVLELMEYQGVRS